MQTFLGSAMTGRRLMSLRKVSSCIDFVESILESGESVVIVSEFVETIEALRTHYGSQCCIVKGGMDDNKKTKSVDEFQAGRKKICLLSLSAGGVGITLTKSEKMVIMDFDWTPANMIQVEDRICRIGQKNPCNIYYLYGADCYLDSYFVEMLTEKNKNIDKVVDMADNQLDLMDSRETGQSFMEYLKEKLGVAFGK